MATYGTVVRRGLPRVPGGDAWPPAGEAPASAVVAAAAPAEPVAPPAAAPAAALTPDAAPLTQDVASAPESRHVESAERAVRRGLPRTPGGEPWPPAASAPVAAATSAPTAPVAAAVVAPDAEAAPASAPAAFAPAASTRAGSPAAVTGDVPIRRGLPRVEGGEPWPPAGFAPAAAPVADPAPVEAAATVAEAPVAAAEAASAGAVVPLASSTDTPLPFTRTVFPGRTPRVDPHPKPEPTRIGPFTRGQWAGAVIVLGGGLLVAAGMAVAFVRWFLSLEFMQDFLATYPGEYHLPEGAPVGFPAWLAWQHFFNVFLMVLIIRSGLQVRNQKRPPGFWSPRWNSKRKISINLWFHQSLDILWILNGLIFIVLLFVTGQWMRLVPTSWEVFPNALSAALQYVSLDWPTENGWVNYNSLQQLAYFVTVFIAAPVAIITGVRMSGVWPSNAKALSKAYPIELARAVHFPTMIYFVLFIIAHVTLVFATGALRNLNHMYAAQGSVDPDAYADNWAGFWIFAASMAVIIGAWVAARPLVLAPIARLFGSVSSR